MIRQKIKSAKKSVTREKKAVQRDLKQYGTNGKPFKSERYLRDAKGEVKHFENELKKAKSKKQPQSIIGSKPNKNMAQNTALKKITTRAKALKKSHPKTKWTDLIKKASKEIKAGKPKTASVSKVHHKKSSNMATAKKRSSGTKKVVVVTGTKRKKSKSHHVGGLKTKMTVMTAGKILLGSILGGSVGAIIYKHVPGSGLVKGGAQLLLGGGGMVMIGEQHPFFFGLANGIGTGGGVNLMHATGVIGSVEEMVSGLFDGMNGVEEFDYRQIPSQTSGHKNNQPGLHEGGYMGVTKEDIDSWIREGLPGQGGDDWK